VWNVWGAVAPVSLAVEKLRLYIGTGIFTSIIRPKGPCYTSWARALYLPFGVHRLDNFALPDAYAMVYDVYAFTCLPRRRRQCKLCRSVAVGGKRGAFAPTELCRRGILDSAFPEFTRRPVLYSRDTVIANCIHKPRARWIIRELGRNPSWEKAQAPRNLVPSLQGPGL